MNTLYASTWINKGIDVHAFISTGRFTYSQWSGLVCSHPEATAPENQITCFSDFRHIHEYVGARDSSQHGITPVLIRIKRPTVTQAPFQHRSETEQTRVRDEAFDFIIDNSGTLKNLYELVDSIV